jgi:hypothetical protein
MTDPEVSDVRTVFGVAAGAAYATLMGGVAAWLAGPEAALWVGPLVAPLAPKLRQCGDSTRRGIDAARSACPGGDCRQLSEAFMQATGRGDAITLVPRATQTLQTVEGVFSSPVAYHQAVLLENGAVVDPLLGATFLNVQAFVQYVVGSQGMAATQVMVNGRVVGM